jgi:hypothetical protein
MEIVTNATKPVGIAKMLKAERDATCAIQQRSLFRILLKLYHFLVLKVQT